MPYLDYLDNPIAAGDEIIYPSGVKSGPAHFNRVTVDEVIPLIPNPDGTGTLVREDHAKKKAPSSLRAFSAVRGWGQNATPIPDEHRFVLVVREKETYGPNAGGYGSRRTIENIRNVLVLPKGA